MGDEDGLQKINLIVKTDVSGSCEAVKAALSALPQDRVQLRFLMASAGEVSEATSIWPQPLKASFSLVRLSLAVDVHRLYRF